MEPDFAVIEFQGRPQPLTRKEAVFARAPVRLGGVRVINDKDRRGAYEGFYPMVSTFRHGKSSRRTGTDWNAPRESATRTRNAGSWATRVVMGEVRR